MNITIQNTLLAGQRPGRTIVATDAAGAEVAALNVAVEQGADSVTLTVEHAIPKWQSGIESSATAPTEALAAEKLVTLSRTTLPTPP